MYYTNLYCTKHVIDNRDINKINIQLNPSKLFHYEIIY